MSLTADQKVNMSLDDLIKANKKSAPKKGGKKITLAKINKKPNAAKRNPRGKKPNQAMDIESKNVVKSTGAAAAKRAAVLANRRGLSDTSIASKRSINKSIASKVSKKNKIQNRKKIGPRGNKPLAAEKIQISFKPAELKQTTEKNTALQIAAVLNRSKPNSSKKGGRNIKM